ncbi:hypothetical protein EIN_009570, partial [Entamoeba invadens IP1]
QKCKGHFMDCLTADTPMPGISLYDNWKSTKVELCDDENCAQCADDGETCYKYAFNNGNLNGVLLNGKCKLTPTDIILEIVDTYDPTYKFCKYKEVNSFFEELVPAYNETTNLGSKRNPILKRSYMYKTQTNGNTKIECAKNNRDVTKNLQMVNIAHSVQLEQNTRLQENTCQPTQYNGQGRDATNQCECNAGYVTGVNKIDVCVQKIEGCSTDGKCVVQNKQINCLACDKEHMAIGFVTTQCSQCIDGYYMVTKKYVKRAVTELDGNAILNGPASEPAKYCTTCKDGFTFNSTDGTCARCPSVCNGCEIKDGNIECKECKNKRNPPKCEYDQGVYLDPIPIHVLLALMIKKFAKRNVTMAMAFTSIVPNTNKFLNSKGKCEQCAENCNVCTDKELCTVCDPKTFRTGFTCEKCVKWYYLDATEKACKQCDSKCENCTSATECKKCIDVNRKPVPKKICKKCNDGY